MRTLRAAVLGVMALVGAGSMSGCYGGGYYGYRPAYVRVARPYGGYGGYHHGWRHW